ncbi:hypothetical protein [Pseudarthrobacter sp. C4D7]|uniref:hypothetical protein n=1 Tax=Pseudarthrobacter sp. C4D7 TaxID=2735268 RepID=UPI0015850F6A|nr:hypothetical protein [Pseudarthrobacter sp. C4D7]NUT70430.1 hypothetical protein [Pseudarthrobacter sp. C4D7]
MYEYPVPVTWLWGGAAPNGAASTVSRQSWSVDCAHESEENVGTPLLEALFSGKASWVWVALAVAWINSPSQSGSPWLPAWELVECAGSVRPGLLAASVAVTVGV